MIPARGRPGGQPRHASVAFLRLHRVVPFGALPVGANFPYSPRRDQEAGFCRSSCQRPTRPCSRGGRPSSPRCGRSCRARASSTTSPRCGPMRATGSPPIARRRWWSCCPRRSEQVSAILAWCHAEGVKVVPRGSGTSLSGGALPLADGVLLGMGKFNRVLDIDYDDRIVVVQPGVTNLAITRAVEEAGFYYAPDPSSQIACSIGGNVAENSGGVHCLKYGLTTNNVLGVELVMMDGEIVRLGGRSLDARRPRPARRGGRLGRAARRGHRGDRPHPAAARGGARAPARLSRRSRAPASAWPT